jgi:hypothetical protein
MHLVENLVRRSQDCSTRHNPRALWLKAVAAFIAL